MSIRIMSQVWAESPASGSALLLLLALANYANDQGVCYPSTAALARDSRLTQRHVQRVLKLLEESGQIAIVREGGPRGCNVYRVAQMSPRPNVGGDMHVAGGATRMSPEPSLEPSFIPSESKVVRAKAKRPLTTSDIEDLKAKHPLRDFQGTLDFWLNHVGFRTAADKPAFLDKKFAEAVERERSRNANPRSNPETRPYKPNARNVVR